MLLAFLLAQVVYFFFFLELERSAVLSAFQLADVVRYLLQVEYFVWARLSSTIRRKFLLFFKIRVFYSSVLSVS